MNRRENAHRHFIRIVAGDFLVHLEQVAVALADDLVTETFDRIFEVEVNRLCFVGPTPNPSSQRNFAWREETSRGARLPNDG